jgi:Family of unknown function (DUF6596)/Sigma-70, region 4
VNWSTLRAVGGLSTAEIASAFLVPEATMAQRIARAKQRIKASGVPFGIPSREEWAARLRKVLHVLYLIFNEGYVGSSSHDLQRPELSDEAMRLLRIVRRMLPDDGEVSALLALMLLIDARRAARTTARTQHGASGGDGGGAVGVEEARQAVDERRRFVQRWHEAEQRDVRLGDADAAHQREVFFESLLEGATHRLEADCHVKFVGVAAGRAGCLA